MMTDQEALKQLLDFEGLTDEDELARLAIFDNICPGICRECGYTTEVEPDSDSGWCEECETTTVVAGTVLLGVI